MKLNPPAHRDDFENLAAHLRTFFHEVHQVRTNEIQPCALGNAYVQFRSALERERFLGPVFRFGNYSMSLIKHDEADNACSFDLDREAWVLLVGFIENLKNVVGIAKTMSGLVF